MGMFIESTKHVIVKSITSTNYVQLDVPTTLSFYIFERAQNTVITSIEYQVEKVNGRSTVVLTPWTIVSMAGVDNHIYTFDYTITGVTPIDKINIIFKVIDIDGQEFFVNINNIDIIA